MRGGREACSVSYEQALPMLREAETLAARAQSIGKQVAALRLQGQCLFRMDRWDEVLVIEERSSNARRKASPEW